MSNILRTAAIFIALSLTWIYTPAAIAASVTLIPVTTTVQEGGEFRIRMRLDAQDALGAHPGSFGGAVVIDFDPALATFNSYAVNAPATLVTPGLTIGSNGNRQTISFGFQNAPDEGRIVTLLFLAIGSPNSIVDFGIADQDDFLGTFANQDPTNEPFIPTFQGTSVAITAIPVPAAAWLMFSALGVIGLGARRRAK